MAKKSTLKDLKKDGKVTMDGPAVKERKHFAPKSKKHSPKSGKGSYKRSQGDVVEESNNISAFVEAVFEKRYSDADKYLKTLVENKLRRSIQKELTTTIF